MSTLNKDILTIFCGAGAQVYVVNGASSTEEVKRLALSHFRLTHSVHHLDESGFGFMSDKTNAVPKGTLYLNLDDTDSDWTVFTG